TLTVQTITPLVMYGADNKGRSAVPELRATSIRGILRYWLRAVLGSQSINPERVYEKESAILGKTETASKVTVQVQASRSMLQSEGAVRLLPERLQHRGYDAGSEFRIVLATHPLADDSIFQGDLLKALYLMTNLGGLGRRSRRGSGNLRVVKTSGVELQSDKPQLDKFAINLNDLTEYLVNVIQFVTSNTQPIGCCPTFPIFAPDTACVLLSNTTHLSYKDAFDELWRVSGPYHHECGVFGGVRPRRASAIHMRVSESRDGYHPMMTILYSGSGNWGKMQEFIEHCRASGFTSIYGDWSNWQ
ncbi:MAG: type III-B CRISPR module RAMP protein Cmr1, partial [Chloroflexi bacterium]